MFKTPGSQQNKRRLQSAKVTKGARQSVSSFGVSQYANPGERPQLENLSKSGKQINKRTIYTKLSSDNKSLQRALLSTNGKKKQSSFMKKMNKPLIMNQVKEDLLDTFMQLID